MTRINSIQDRKAGASGTSQIPVNLAYRVKMKSTLLVTVTWQTGGAPNAVGISGVSVIPDPANSPGVQVPIAYQSLAGTGSAVPIYAGPSGNTINMAVLAVKAKDIRAVQGTVYPSNVVVIMSGTVAKATIQVTEFANFPSFKYRDIQVTNVSNVNGTSLTLSSSQRPSSLDIVGMAVATPNTRTVSKPWGGADGRYLGTNGLANMVATLAPWAMTNLQAIAHGMGGIGSTADAIRGGASLIDAAYVGFSGGPFNTSTNAMSWEASGVENTVTIANWISNLFIKNMRDITEADLQYVDFVSAGGSQSLANSPFFIFGRGFLANPSAAAALDGTAPAIVDAVTALQVRNGDVILDAVEQSDVGAIFQQIANTINTARANASLAPLTELHLLNLYDVIGAGESGGAEWGEVLGFLGEAGQIIEQLIVEDGPEELGPFI